MDIDKDAQFDRLLLWVKISERDRSRRSFSAFKCCFIASFGESVQILQAFRSVIVPFPFPWFFGKTLLSLFQLEEFRTQPHFAMNFKCSICSELFTPAAELYGTPCGHIFHLHCLMQWIHRSKTCPQCRCKATEKSVHRIYLSVEENGEPTDPSTLLNTVDNLHFQARLKDKDIKNARDKCKVLEKQNAGLREEIKSHGDKLSALQSSVYALQEKITFFKSKSKECERLEEELQILKKKLEDMGNVEMALRGSREQVNDLLRHNTDSQSLALLVTTLKKELVESDKGKKKLQARLKEEQNKAQSFKLEASRSMEQLLRVQQDLQAHKNCEVERQYLKSKIAKLAVQCQSAAPDTSVERIHTESPAPLVKAKQLQVGQANPSPSVTEKVQSIKNSDSPYLQIQSSSVGYGLLNYRPSSAITQTNSIFKSSVRLERKRPPSGTSYDGLGGHSKDDLLEFPKPVKRPKTATVTSAKFKKLAPPQKKLDAYFNNSQ